MPELGPGIHDLATRTYEDVDGRDRPGHDDEALRDSYTLPMPPAAGGDLLGELVALRGRQHLRRLEHRLHDTL